MSSLNVLRAIGGSPAGWRVMLGFAFKGIDYEVVHVDGSRKEHQSLEFLSLNPRGKVPVLESQGYVIRDSIAILDFKLL